MIQPASHTNTNLNGSIATKPTKSSKIIHAAPSISSSITHPTPSNYFPIRFLVHYGILEEDFTENFSTQFRSHYQGTAQPASHIYFDAIADLDGDGKNEIVTRMTEVVTHFENLSSDHTKPATQSTFHFPRIVILNPMLEQLTEHIFASEWRESYDFKAWVTPDGPGKSPSIYVIADRFYQLEFHNQK